MAKKIKLNKTSGSNPVDQYWGSESIYIRKDGNNIITLSDVSPTNEYDESSIHAMSGIAVKSAIDANFNQGSITKPKQQKTESTTALSNTVSVNEQYFKIKPTKGTITAGYLTVGAQSDGDEVNYKVKPGSAVTPPTTITVSPSITVDSSTGKITATNNKSESITPTVSDGWVSKDSVSAGTISVTGSNTKQLSTQEAQIITPGTSDQTISAGKYLTGDQTIKGDVGLIAENIKFGVTIFGITGTFAGGVGEWVTPQLKESTLSCILDAGETDGYSNKDFFDLFTQTGLARGAQKDHLKLSVTYGTIKKTIDSSNITSDVTLTWGNSNSNMKLTYEPNGKNFLIQVHESFPPSQFQKYTITINSLQVYI